MYFNLNNIININRIYKFHRYRNCLIHLTHTRQHSVLLMNQHNVLFNVNAVFLTKKRYYRPDLNIDWVGIRRRWHTKQLIDKKKKHKNHPRVALRFRLTRFGWERLQSGRNAKKFNLSRLKYKNKMRIKYVSRSDLKKLKRQMPGYNLRIRDPPINNNPNIRKIRQVINSYFG